MRPERRPGRARSPRSSSGSARSEPSANSTRDASRSNSSASSVEMPRWRRPLCACVKASAKVREAALGSRYFCASASAVSRSGAMPVAKRQTHRRARHQPDPLAQAEDRIEHDAGRARQRAAVERRRVVGVAAAAEEARAIGLPFDRPLRPALEAQDVHRPHRAARAESRGRRWQSSAALSARYSVSRNSLPNAGCARSSAGARQDDFGVAGDVDLADPRALIDHRHPAHLDVVFGRDRDVELRRDLVVVAAERRALGAELDDVVVRLRARSDGRSPTRPSRCARRAGRRTGCPDRASDRAATA